ncbi:GNAT family N-acetyltransferase [Pseudonocardia lacus]|uniref:GNAT family N-acetyltransferase n=1 Tax=Pseudonocardia lacus TaxID=2835865 RepID=UPI0038B45F43
MFVDENKGRTALMLHPVIFAVPAAKVTWSLVVRCAGFGWGVCRSALVAARIVGEVVATWSTTPLRRMGVTSPGQVADRIPLWDAIKFGFARWKRRAWRISGPVPIVVEPVTPARWRRLRRVRLQSLKDAPRAFTDSYARERNRRVVRKEHWVARIESSEWVIALRPGIFTEGTVGVARLLPQDPDGVQFIECVWVRPWWRGMGIVELMINDLERRAQKAGSTELSLWVLQGNAAAWKAYKKLGFKGVGKQFLPKEYAANGRRVLEHRMSRAIAQPVAASVAHDTGVEPQDVERFREVMHGSDALDGVLPTGQIGGPGLEPGSAELGGQQLELASSGGE